MNHEDLEFPVERLGVPRERATVVLNGIPPELEGLPLGGAGDTLGMAMLGTWASRKGVRDGAEALSRVLRDKDVARGLLLGTRVQAREVLADFDEGFSVAILEGMAAGLGLVATALAGTREIVRDRENGLLVPPRDSASLAAGVLRLAGDRELLERLRRATRADAQALTWRRIAERNLEVYAEAGAR
jgi:glycosyltransferase involved in cell wall biosynthesis